VRDQAPAADDELAAAVTVEADERARCAREDLARPGHRRVAPADLEKALDVGLLGADVSVARLPPRSEPANSQFQRPSAIGRIRFSM
jgi:hypothetical protein